MYKGIKDVESNCVLVERMLNEGNVVEIFRVKDFMIERLWSIDNMI